MSIRNISGDDDSSDNLAEFRKNLHSLLHKNDHNNNNNNNSNKIRRENKEIPVLRPIQVQKIETNKLLKKVEQLENKIKELDKIVELKNTKILSLSTTNVENIKVIQNLNSKISDLHHLITSKDSQIDKLEKIIIKMQKLSKDEDNNRKHYHQYETNKNISNYDGNSDSFSDDNDDNSKKMYKDYDLHIDSEIDDNSTTKLLNSRNIQDFENDINLNTQQLLHLDLDRLTLKNVGPSIYNSNSVGVSYTKDCDNDSELEEYLFPV